MRFICLLSLLLATSACAESIKERQRKPGTSYGPVTAQANGICYDTAMTKLNLEMTAALRAKN